jgi:hypothetical protein
MRALLIFNGLRSRYCQRALLVYHYRKLSFWTFCTANGEIDIYCVTRQVRTRQHDLYSTTQTWTLRLRRGLRRHHPQHLPTLHDTGHQVETRHDRKRSRAVFAAARGGATCFRTVTACSWEASMVNVQDRRLCGCIPLSPGSPAYCPDPGGA